MTGNVCQAWSATDAEWDSLPPCEREAWESYHRSMLAVELSLAKQGAAAAASKRSGAGATSSAASGAKRSGSNIIGCNEHVLSEVDGHVVHNVGGGVRKERRRAAESAKPLGMTAEVFQQFLAASNLSTRAAAEVWDRQHGFCLAKDRGEVPQRTRYQRACHGLCSAAKGLVCTERRRVCSRLEEFVKLCMHGRKESIRNLKFAFIINVYEDEDE